MRKGTRIATDNQQTKAALFFTSLVPIVALQVVGVRAAIGWFLACLLLLIGLALKWFTGIVTPIELDPATMGTSPIRAAIIFLISVSVTLAASDIARKANQRREKLAEDVQKRHDQTLAEEERAIFMATTSSTQHILNNLLNQMKYFKAETDAAKFFDDETNSLYEGSMTEDLELVEKLSAVNVLTEENIKASVYPKSEKGISYLTRPSI
ncbi:MAG: hypothetical protein VCA12_14900 [Pseudomonadales bacterium]